MRAMDGWDGMGGGKVGIGGEMCWEGLGEGGMIRGRGWDWMMDMGWGDRDGWRWMMIGAEDRWIEGDWIELSWDGRDGIDGYGDAAGGGMRRDWMGGIDWGLDMDCEGIGGMDDLEMIDGVDDVGWIEEEMMMNLGIKIIGDG
ncbi:hypothetical protein Tco_0031169 [Tanacetum coccineum]